MRLLIVTQALDLDDPTLSVYHDWVAALAQRSESVIAVCLKEGRHDLPANVRVYSLGKERGSAPGFIYAIRFKWLAWKLRNDYDRVFVHMNQEYILIAGWLWKLLQKPVYMWRNHYVGSLLTDIAAGFCTKVFCTSKHSYTAKYKKTILMPVGVDLERFGGAESASVVRVPNSILFFGRMAPVKRPDVLVDALSHVRQKGIPFTATFLGSPLPAHEEFYMKLKDRARANDPDGRIAFMPGIPNTDAPDAYRAHDVFVNATGSGAFDKTLFEAAASGCLVLAASDDFAAQAGPQAYFDGTAEALAARLESLLMLPKPERAILSEKLKRVAEANSLSSLMQMLISEL